MAADAHGWHLGVFHERTDLSPAQSVEPWISRSRQATPDALNNSASLKNKLQALGFVFISTALTTHTALLIRIVPNRAGFPDVTLWRSPSLWWRPSVNLKLATTDPENDLWLGRWSICSWDVGFFILAGMNYWDVQSAMSWSKCVCVCVCAWVKRPTGRLPSSCFLPILHQPHTRLILAGAIAFNLQTSHDSTSADEILFLPSGAYFSSWKPGYGHFVIGSICLKC